MREIKFSYMFKAACGDRFFEKILTLDELESDRTLRGPINMNGKLVARRRFAGIQDADGKDIYEGDIFTCDQYPFYSDGNLNYVGIIEYIDDPAYLAWYYGLAVVSDRVRGGACGSQLSELEDVEITVIGNIHQNPDLVAG